MLSGFLMPVLIILLMVAFNALYVVAEFATVGARRSRVQDMSEEGHRSAAVLLEILRDHKRLDDYIAGTQVGITITSIVAGAYGQAKLTPLLTPWLGGVGGRLSAIILVLFIVTTLQVILGELLPKTIALRYPEKMALTTLRPMRLSLLLFRPLILLFNGSAFLIMKWVGLNTEQSHSHVHSPEELEVLYRESAAGGLINARERDMLAGALNVDDRMVREIMTPRTRMITAKASEMANEALGRLAESAHSRFPVQGENPEDIVGVVQLRALFAAARNGKRKVADVMHPPLVVADVMLVPDLWEALRNANCHLAIVVNEYGSVAGMVTLEDALEEVFGEMQDEFDQEEEPIVVQGRLVSARGDVLIETLNQRFDLTLNEEHADTISGLVWHELGRLPAVGDKVPLEDAGITMQINMMQHRAIQRVSFTLPEPSKEESDV